MPKYTKEFKIKLVMEYLTMVLKNKGFNINHKRVLRIMKEESLLCSKFKTRSRKYSSYKGQIGKVADNIVKRQFLSLLHSA
ncbi:MULTISPECIES: IS3 family transposase [Streptococcus]|uniref:IS3 family transposase n=1 Tax=Streptococcus TaxID=1301 RepID=UPI0011063CE7|nr:MULTISPECIES: IS3 family transposase [Streptococcus]